MCPEGFATEVTLVRPLAAVYTQVHVQVVLLGERMAAQVTNKRALVPVRQSEGKVQTICTDAITVFTCQVSLVWSQ